MIISDDDLVIRCKAELPRKTESYELLVQRHMNYVYNLVYRVVRQKEEAEDVTQEVFVKVYSSIRTFDQRSSFSTWLYRIAVNSALDHLDKAKRQRRVVTPFSAFISAFREEEKDGLDSQKSPLPGPEEAAMQRDLRECIQNVLRKLDREHARVLIMRDFEDWSYDDIMQALGARLSAVKMRIHRARLAFQHIFNQFCGQMYTSFSPTKERQSGTQTKMAEGNQQ
jgi:RNA polymerase sigma-70 factor, ECF subfamily